jgi:acyl-CoA thioesterase-1
MMRKHFLLFAALVLCAACGNRAKTDTAAQSDTSATTTVATTLPNASSTNNSTSDKRPRIVAFGDSLAAGFGLPEKQGFTALLQKKLDADGFNYEVVNAAVPGETSADGLRRIDWTLDDPNGGKIEFMILELGGNDVLRGNSPAQMRKNLAQIIERAQARNIKIILAGIYAPTSNGREYQRDTISAFRSLADEYKLPFIPFVLENVAGNAKLNQADGIHPNAEGEKIMTDTIYRTLKPLLEEQRKEQINTKLQNK